MEPTVNTSPHKPLVFLYLIFMESYRFSPVTSKGPPPPSPLSSPVCRSLSPSCTIRVPRPSSPRITGLGGLGVSSEEEGTQGLSLWLR